MVKRFDGSNDINELIQEAYGSPEGLAEILNLGMEMLFYLEEDTFEQRDIQHVASAIKLVRGFFIAGEDLPLFVQRLN